MTTSPRRQRYPAIAAVAVLAVAAFALSGCNTIYGSTLAARRDDPVVFSGSALTKLNGVDPWQIVAFAWDGRSWHQVPVQVDERDLVSPGVLYHLPQSAWPDLYGTTTPYKMLVYTPPPAGTPGYTSTDTYTPPDSDPTLDANDQVSLLANEAGRRADSSVENPGGVDGASREQVEVHDPLDPTASGYVYLFHSSTLSPAAAGSTGVHYTFSLDSGNYRNTYKMGTSSLAPNNSWGLNPEHSNVDTPAYSLGFSDRWLNDSMTAKAAGASASNLIDRAKYFAKVFCGRTEDTFDGKDTGEGAFIVNISGPVRALRSYLGANSYKYTVNTQIFYPQWTHTVTELRGHAGLPSFGQATDYRTGLALQYFDPANPSGVTVDGQGDTVTPITAQTGQPLPAMWQLVGGEDGSVVTSYDLDTSKSGLTVTSSYDDASPTSTCTGDSSKWGQSGVDLTGTQTLVTDPTLTASPATVTATRDRYFGGSIWTSNAAQRAALVNLGGTIAARARQPLTVTISAD